VATTNALALDRPTPRVRLRSGPSGLLVGALAALMVFSIAPPPAAMAASDGASCTKDQPCTLRIRTVAPRRSPWGELLDRLSKAIQDESDGRVDIRIYWQSRSEPSAVRQCLAGRIGGIAVSNGALASAVPELEATEMPYLFDDYAQADKALTAATDLLKEILLKRGFVYGIRGENGFRHFASRETIFNTPRDMAGVSMRSQPARHHLDMYQALGATPNPIQVAEVASSLANGIVGGYDNTLLYADLANWSAEIRYVTLSSHIYQGALVAWCKGWFDGLPADIQAILTKPRPQLESVGLQLVRVFNDRRMPEKYKQMGIQMATHTPAQRAVFRDTTAGVERAFRGRTTDDGRQLLDLLKRAR